MNDQHEPETTRQALEALAAERVEQVPVRRLPAHKVDHRLPDGTLVQPAAPVPAERTGGTMPEHVPASDQALVHLGGAVQVERVLAQPDVPEVRHALMAYAPAGRYRYDVGLTTTSPWGDADTFHVIKVWVKETADSRTYSASGRVAGMLEPSAVAATVQGILNALERIKAIHENRDTYQVRTPDTHPDGSPVVYGNPARRYRPIKDQPQA